MKITMKLTDEEYRRLMLFRKLTPEQQREINEIFRNISEMFPAETANKPREEVNV